MYYCKVCGMPLPGRWKGDYDAVQQHAYLFHFDLVDYYSPQEVRDLISRGSLGKAKK